MEGSPQGSQVIQLRLDEIEKLKEYLSSDEV